jgi:CheY-like chemotaxis protein
MDSSSGSKHRSTNIVSWWLEAKAEMSTPYMSTEQSVVNKGVEVLSVDDDPVNQEVMEDLLSGLGYKVTVAMSGLEALKILEERFETEGAAGFPRVVLMDNMMPGMTGLEATQKIREVYPMVEMPIIMVSVPPACS